MTMSDDDLGRFANAILADLDCRNTYEGKVLTLGRIVRHLEEQVAPRTAVPRIGDFPGFKDAMEAARDRSRLPRFVSALLDAPKTPATQNGHLPTIVEDRLDLWAKIAGKDVAELTSVAPGPTTLACRRIASLAVAAQFCCQCGEFARAVPMLWCCTMVIGDLRARVPFEGDLGPLSTLYVLASVGTFAADHPYPVTATCLARRLAADLGATTRAASRHEGRPDLDPVFEEVESDSVSGMQGERAVAAALALERALATPPVSSAAENTADKAAGVTAAPRRAGRRQVSERPT